MASARFGPPVAWRDVTDSWNEEAWSQDRAARAADRAVTAIAQGRYDDGERYLIQARRHAQAAERHRIEGLRLSAQWPMPSESAA